MSPSSTTVPRRIDITGVGDTTHLSPQLRIIATELIGRGVTVTSVSNTDSPRHHRLSATTDDGATFVVDEVPPSDITVTPVSTLGTQLPTILTLNLWHQGVKTDPYQKTVADTVTSYGHRLRSAKHTEPVAGMAQAHPDARTVD